MCPRRGAPPLFVVYLFCIDLAFALMYVLFFGLGRDLPLGWMFDVNREATIPTWYSSMQLFLIGAALLPLVYIEYQRDRGRRWLLWLLPMLFFAMSLDEVATLHEWLGKHLDTVFMPGGDRANSAVFRGTGIWVVAIPMPFLVLMAFLYARLRDCFNGLRRELKIFASGLAIFILGAVVSESIYNYISWSGMAVFIQILSEELAEMVGATVMLWAVYEALFTRGFSIRLVNPPTIETMLMH